MLEREGFNKETKLQVPDLVWKGTKETVEYYLRGLYVTDGHIQSSNEVCSLVLASVDKSFYRIYKSYGLILVLKPVLIR